MSEESQKDIAELLRSCRRIVVIRQRFVGDAVWTLPFLENLRLNLPEATIAVVSNEGTEGFFLHNDYIDRCITYPERRIKNSGKLKAALLFLGFLRELRSFKADAVIELTDSDKSAVIAFLSGARTRIGQCFEMKPRHRLLNHMVPFSVAMHWVPLYFEFFERLGLRVFTREIHNAVPKSAFEELRLKAPALFENTEKKKILVHPGARALLRQWGTAKFARLCDLLSAEFRIILTAGPDEVDMLEEVRAQMATKPEYARITDSLLEFAALSAICDLFVGNDSGPIHMAATQVFTVGLYGPNSDKFAGPWTRHKYIFEDPTVACRTSCDHKSCTHTTFHACFSGTTPEVVAAKIREVLGPRGGRDNGKDLGKGYIARGAPGFEPEAKP